ncbi:WD repeat and coiled-coil-containing protein-like [Ambystoma mexicanum]|uniref:WD repeat and coiled-coil-containing protein-like n=1 Tax=Ambystoma mexicanum TaxID=8296 RepID=UPI0037E7F10B
MELGKAKLLRTGLNALGRAFHPVHGLVWTDGRRVVLTDLHLQNGEPKFGTSSVIGEFEHVHGLSWGPLGTPDVPALLAVQHKKHVTVWQVQTIPMEKNRLLLSQTCQKGEPFPVLPQGSVWHPQKEMLVILTKQDASLLHSVRFDSSNIRVDFKSDGFIHCACWTTDGNRLVIAAGGAIHSYIWDDTQKTLNVCMFCPVFEVGGYICAIESTLDSEVAVATELSLGKVCGLSMGSSFDVPVSAKTSSLSPQSSLLYLSERLARDLRRNSIDSEQSIATDSVVSSSSGPVDLTPILAKHRSSDPSPLIHLRRPDFRRKNQDASYLILVTFGNNVTTTRKIHIPARLMPDIVTFDRRGQLAAVASNTCNVILVYSLAPSTVPNIQQIQLEKNERSKGLCFLTDSRLLVLVGRQKFNEPAFYPSSSSEKYIVRLVIKELMLRDGSSTVSSACQSLLIDFDATVNEPDGRLSLENGSREECLVSREHLMPNCTTRQSPSAQQRLIELVTCNSSGGDQSPISSSGDFDDNKISMDSTVVVETLDTEPINRLMAMINMGATSRASSRYSSSKTPLKKHNRPPYEGAHIPGDRERLCGGCARLEQHLPQLKGSAKNGKTFPAVYPSVLDPPYVLISLQKPISEGAVIENTRAVLLCDGKLQLSTVQHIFHLTVMEIKHGSSWIVLTADSEGFIPLAFRAAQEITIRNASSTSRIPRGNSAEEEEITSSGEIYSTTALEVIE